MVAGGFDYLMKIRVRDIHEFRDMLGDMLSRLPYVRETHTYVVMEEAQGNDPDSAAPPDDCRYFP